MTRDADMRWMASILAISLIGCSDARSVAPEEAVPRSQVDAATARAVRVGCEPAGFTFSICWRGAPSISVRVPTAVSQQAYSDIISAADNWNDLLREGSFGQPRLSVSRGTGGNVAVSFPAGENPSGYCGEVFGSGQSYSMLLYPATSTNCSAAVSGTLKEAFRHEITLPIGWADDAERLQVPGVSDNCSLYIVDGSFKQQVCLHEVEGVFRAYRGLGVPADFWSMGILRRSDLDTNKVTLLVGQSLQLAVRALGSSPPESYPLNNPTGPDSLLFSSTTPAVATVSALGRVNAVAVGTSVVKVRGRQDRLPSNRLPWSPLETDGDKKTISVRRDSLLRVTNITSPGAPPFTTAGSKIFTAAIAGAADAPAVKVRWVLDYSHTVANPDLSSVTSGTALTTYVDGGSYSIRLTAIPIQGADTGAAYQGQFPVCAPVSPARQLQRPGGC